MFLTLLAASAPALLLAVWLAARARARNRCRPLAELPALPVALVLGAQMHPGGQPSHYLQARLDRAVELYRAKKVERCITSGDDGAGSNHEATHMADYLVRRGVPVSRITIDPAGYDTHASCRRARDVYGVTRLVVVSQSYHLPRALLICRRLGLDAWGYGDWSVRDLNGGRTWRWGVVREIGAMPKVARDLLSGPRPVVWSGGSDRRLT